MLKLNKSMALHLIKSSFLVLILASNGFCKESFQSLSFTGASGEDGTSGQLFLASYEASFFKLKKNKPPQLKVLDLLYVRLATGFWMNGETKNTSASLAESGGMSIAALGLKIENDFVYGKVDFGPAHISRTDFALRDHFQTAFHYSIGAKAKSFSIGIDVTHLSHPTQVDVGKDWVGISFSFDI